MKTFCNCFILILIVFLVLNIWNAHKLKKDYKYYDEDKEKYDMQRELTKYKIQARIAVAIIEVIAIGIQLVLILTFK